ncbi:MAG: xanthine dehydrogenase family protein molybdopterin-binding subunit [Gammaproteobacteria bacterium]
MKAAAPRFVGTSIPRKEDPRFLTGRGRYIDDLVVPGMLHACFVRSQQARARIVSVDVQAARALPGVRAVYTAADLNHTVRPLHYNLPSQASALPPMPPLAAHDVRYVGDPIAIVLAEDRYLAEDAAELVVVELDSQAPMIDYHDALDGAAVHPELGTNLAFEGATAPDAGLDAAFAGAAHVVTHTISTPRQSHSPMETRGIVASAPGRDEIEVALSTQNPHIQRGYLAALFGLGEHRVRVTCGDVGGGFGLKFHMIREEVAVICAARLVGRPVKWIEDRMENLIASSHGRMETATVRLALDGDGLILAAHLDYLGDVGAYPGLPPEMIPWLMNMMFTGPYRIPKFGWRSRTVFTNTCGMNSYRGPWAMESLARESAIEAAARQLGICPFDLRRRNVLRAADLPYTTAGGAVFDRVTPAETMEQALARLDLPAFRAEQARARAQGRFLGVGMSLYLEPTGMPGGVPSGEVANVRVEISGHVTATMSVHSAGNSTETTMAQLIADELGVSVDDVSVNMGDTRTIGPGMGVGGSRQAVIGGNAAQQAARLLRERVLGMAAYMLETRVDDLVLEEGRAWTAHAPRRSVSLAEIAQRAYGGSAEIPQGMAAGLEAQYRYVASEISYSNAAHVCTCEVDMSTGKVRLLRWIVSEDAGTLINPAVVDGQIAGGAVQGIAEVLYEEMPYDADGNPLATTFKDYLMPLITDIPEFEFEHHSSPGPSPAAIKGVGEGGAIVAPAAAVNAIADALAPLGIACNVLPLSPDRLLGKSA